MSAKKLTNKEKFFIENYIKCDFNAAAAARESGYSKKTAKNSGKRLIDTPYIKKEIDKKIKELLNQTHDDIKYKLLDLYQTRAFFDPKEIITDDGELKIPLSEMGILSKCIEGIKIKKGYYSEKSNKEDDIEIKLTNREKAMEMLAKYLGMIKEVHEYGGKDGGPIEICNLSKKEYADIRKKMLKKDDI